MSYVQSVLQPGEQVRHTAKLHWVLYWPGIAFSIAALVAFFFAQTGDRGSGLWLYLAGVLLIIAMIFLIREWFVWWTTEIAITDRRVISKKGFISRSTVEMHMDKVESVDVEQTILGRILDYGTVTVKGVGTGFEPLTTIAAPLELRNHITGV
jgi:uncharacterized membrane protein YdbT with pleckstrin-like domain